jgi:hypothetical protein
MAIFRIHVNGLVRSTRDNVHLRPTYLIILYLTKLSKHAVLKEKKSDEATKKDYDS